MRLNRAQRVVVVIAWGLVIAVGARWLELQLWDPGPGDWFNYAPQNAISFARSDLHTEGLVVWLAAVVLWTAGALLLLRSPRTKEERTG